MCGIAGKLLFDVQARITRDEIEGMLQPALHRGPDSQGVLLDGPVGLGHNRLSIIDLSGGLQPMANEDETVWIAFNGEIYNFMALREQLISQGHRFKTKSDTEVIIHLYEEYGPDCVKRLRGMFAFAIWDSRNKRLFLARDRVGIKPLYYLKTERALYFASELKSIIADSNVSVDVDLRAIRQFLSFYYLPGEHTLCQGIHKLLPGHWLMAEAGQVRIERYWDLRFTKDRWHVTFDDAAAELRDLLASTVRDHMIADVPVGVLASGGVDSSAVLAAAVNCTSKRVKTFTVGFDGGGVVDERPYAQLAAQRFGTDHHEVSITAAQFGDFLPSYVWHMEDPVCEPPAVALYYVTQLARRHVKVLLSGEGGDEAFAGYSNYAHLLRLEQIQRMLGPLARGTGMVASIVANVFGGGRLSRYGAALGRPLTDHYFSRTSGPSTLFNASYKHVLTNEFATATADHSAVAHMERLMAAAHAESLLDRMLYVDTTTWLPDDLLVKADKMTMANSVELRVPLLDHEVLEFAASLPPEYKVSGLDTKRILKSAVQAAVPDAILNRKKAGFPVPYAAWLRGPLEPMVRDILLSSSATGRGYFRTGEVRRLLDAHTKTGARSKEIFSLLVLELWHREFVDKSDMKNKFSGARVTTPAVIARAV
jgi:asparagine synthase (glutamine-hydrolysing)